MNLFDISNLFFALLAVAPIGWFFYAIATKGRRKKKAGHTNIPITFWQYVALLALGLSTPWLFKWARSYWEEGHLIEKCVPYSDSPCGYHLWSFAVFLGAFGIFSAWILVLTIVAIAKRIRDGAPYPTQKDDEPIVEIWCMHCTDPKLITKITLEASLANQAFQCTCGRMTYFINCLKCETGYLGKSESEPCASC